MSENIFRRLPRNRRGHGSFTDGLTFMGGAFLAALAGGLVLFALLSGGIFLVWWHNKTLNDAEIEKNKQMAELVLKAEQQENEQKTKVLTQVVAAEQAKKEAQEAKERLEKIRAAAEIERKRLEAERAKAESDKARVETERFRAAMQARKESEAKAAREQAEKEKKAKEEAEAAAERERKRREIEEFNRPVPIAAKELWRKGKELVGRTVVLDADAMCKVFTEGHVIVTFLDTTKKYSYVRCPFDKVDKKWGLEPGSNFVKMKLQGVVDKIEGGTVLLRSGQIQKIYWEAR